MKDLLVLLTNDDGIEAAGLCRLADAFRSLGRVVVVAPHEERSGVGHGLTMRQPLRIIEKGRDRYGVTGTPVDCVIFALRELLSNPPDLMISGINNGANLGDDVQYSGTVAAAREACFRGIPAIAASLAARSKKPRFDWAARVVRELVGELFPDAFSEGTFLNVNIPEGKPKSYRFTRQGARLPALSIRAREDRRGNRHYWIDRDEKEWLVEADTDYRSVSEGAVSITPLQRDQTDYRALRGLGKRGDR